MPDLGVKDEFACSPEEQSSVDQLHRIHTEFAVDVLVDARPAEKGELVNPVGEDEAEEDDDRPSWND
jgi:hypothetical protein